jgi:SAM-dependent methyltransferase
LENGQADLLLNVAAFHHIPSKKLRLSALSEMQRVLKKQGILIVTVWNLWQWKYFRQILLALLKSLLSLGNFAPNDLFIPWKNSQQKVLASRYYHNFLPFEIKSLFKKSGFKILKSFYTLKGRKTSFFRGFNYIIIAKNER